MFSFEILKRILPFLYSKLGISIIMILLFGSYTYFNNISHNREVKKLNIEIDNQKHIVYNKTKELEELKVSLINEVNVLLEKNIKLNNDLKKIENDAYNKYNEKMKENEKIIANLRSVNNGLRISVKKSNICESSGNGNTKSPSVDDGETIRAVIDPKDAETIISITNEGDKYRLQLQSLQDWIQKILNKEIE